MKTTLLVGPSVDLPPARRAAWVRKRIREAKPDALIGVDGGTELLNPSDRPQLVIGDWDSGDAAVARRFARAGAKMVTLPRRKDASDLACALEALGALSSTAGKRTTEARQLLLIGFTGGRPDHFLAGLSEIARFAAAHAGIRARGRPSFQKIAAIGPEAEYHFLTPGLSPLELTRASRKKARNLVSVFAWGVRGVSGGIARGVTMTGFEYGMRNGVLEPSSRGLSNRIRAPKAMLRVRKGVLVAVLPHD